MKNKKVLLVSLIALLAILLSACAGAVTETPAQTVDTQSVDAPSSAPVVDVSLNGNPAAQNGQNGQGKGGRGKRDLTAAAEALGVTVEELQAAIQNARPAECADQTTPPTQGVDCRPDMNAVAESLGVTVEELQTALGKGGRGQRDLTAAAEALGVTVEELETAIQNARPAECVDGEPAQGVDCRPDANALAESLGVTVEELEAVLGRRGGPDFAAAAEALAVTEEELKQALQDAKPAECAAVEEGAPKDPNCRPDIDAAAATLGVTTEELQQALGKPEGGHGGNP